MHVEELSVSADEGAPRVVLGSALVVSHGVLLECALASQLAANAELRLRRVRSLEQPVWNGETRITCRAWDNALQLFTAGPAFDPLVLTAELTPLREPDPRGHVVGKKPFSEPSGSVDFYRELARDGMVVDPESRVVLAASIDGDRARARLGGAYDTDSERGFVVGPRRLDAAVQLAQLFVRRTLGSVGACVWIDELDVVNSEAHPVWVHLERAAATESCRGVSPDHLTVDIELLDVDCKVVTRLRGVGVGTPAWAQAAARAEVTTVLRGITRSCVAAYQGDDQITFASLGLTSLDLVRVTRALDERLGWSPPWAEFVADPRVATIADLYLRRLGAPRPTNPGDDSDTLSPLESQLWFLERLTNVSPSYNEGRAWLIRGEINIVALDRALRWVQERHPALRSHFPAVLGTPQRQIGTDPIDLKVSHLEADLSPAALLETIEHTIREPFDLEHRAAFRGSLLMQSHGCAVLVLVAHHIVCDAWSFERVILPELVTAYAAAIQGTLDARASELAPQPAAGRQRGYIDAAEQHYRTHLADVPHLLDFPFDHPRPPQQTHRGSIVRGALGARAWANVKRLARQLEVSPFVVTLAAYQIVLHRYCRQTSFCIGLPISLRRSAAEQSALGCFVNMAVLRVNVEANVSFGDYCRLAHQELVACMRFDAFGLSDVVRAVAPARSLSHTPLVQAVFGYHERGETELRLVGLDVVPLHVHNRAAKFDLALEVTDTGCDAELAFEYASDLIEAAAAEHLLSHYRALLDHAVHSPQTAVSGLRLTSQTEAQWLAVCAAGATREITPIGLGLGLLANHADSASVLHCTADTWSAQRLRDAGARIVAALRDAGVRPREFVAICMPRSGDWVAGVLAVLEVGAAYAALDPSNPRERLRHGISSCGARVALVSDSQSLRDAPELRVLDVRSIIDGAGSVERPVRADVDVAAPVYGIMTSGSTGTPRVAAVTHKGFGNLLRWYVDALQLDAHDKVFWVTSPGFDLSQKNVFASLLAGSQLIIDDAAVTDPGLLCDTIERHAVTILNCTPSLAHELVRSAAESGMHKLRSLRILVLGGEPIDWAALRPWTSHPSCKARVMNSYGPTECTDVVAAAFVEPTQGPAALGEPIPNVICRAVDISGNDAGTGVPGELWIGGLPVGLGYLNDPAATQARFVLERDQRWYRSGDLVRRRANGQLAFMGRIDTQVKVRGYRIELAEVETAIKTLPEVHDVLVRCVADRSGTATLVAYVQADAAGSDAFALRLRRELASIVPSYMIPQVVLPIERIPRTVSGKVDRNAHLDAAPSAGSRATSDTTLLARVTRTWANVLSLTSVSSDANFFECGGHSLAAIQATSQLGAELDCRLPVASMFEYPILRDYAEWLARELPRMQARNDGQMKPGM